MKVLLVYTVGERLSSRRPLDSMADIHIGLSYVAAQLKAHGHTTRLIVLGSELEAQSLGRLTAAVEEFDPQLVAFTAVSTQFPFASAAGRRLRKRWPDKYLILGGMHASLMPAEAIEGPFDAICVGEGELAAGELVEQLEGGRVPRGIPNLWIRHPDGSVERNATRPFLENLEGLPFPDRDMWREWVMATRLTRQVVLPSRGCPYNCSYCSNHALRKLAGGKYVRFRAPEDVVREIRFLKERYPEASEIYLQSETIAVNLNWLRELADRVAAFNAELAEKISFACNFRVARQFLTDEVFGALARANVRRIEIGLESGSPRVRSEVLRRNYSDEEFLRAVALARSHSMSVSVYNMIGLPTETPAEHQATVELNHRVCPDASLTGILYPYPGTDLYDLCKEKGWLVESGDPAGERSHAVLDLPTFPKAEVDRAWQWFDYRVYRGHRSLQFRLRKVARAKLLSHPVGRMFFTRLMPLWHGLRGR